jgi:predicted ester cyclase
MEEMMLKNESLSLAQKNLQAYFETHDVKYLTEDAVFKNLSTGETYKGRAEIGAMLHYTYHVAFDAKAEFTNYIIEEDKAQVEGLFKGKHIGEIAGIAATNKEVAVPLCVTYELKDGLIKEARIYMLINVMMQQLGVTAGAPGQKTTFLVRDIFHLKFGQYRPAKKLLEEAVEKKMMPEAKQARVLTDFTGDAYRLIFEEGFDSLAAYETSLTSSMKTDEWQSWYERFKPLVESSSREILKQVM